VAAAEVLQKSLRGSDILGRLGGDEFTALLVLADKNDVVLVKNRIAKECETANRQLNKAWKLSMSIGYSIVDHDDEIDLQKIMDDADADLYTEKTRKKTNQN
jgi:diguanylate cyclase (GGDEF)-like protein